MSSKVLDHFFAMRPSVRSLVFLYWIYAFTGGMVGVFTQIFLYQKFTSITLNVIAAMILYTGIMIGFCVPGFLAATWRLNIKQGFMWSFVLNGFAILYLLRTETVAHAYSAMFLWGVGQGVFWLTVNTFELSETKDHECDYYSSVLNAGNQVLSLAGPATATLLIWCSSVVLHLGTYTLLFTFAPAVYLLGFFCFSSIRDYRPNPVVWADVRHYFIDTRNQAAQVYTMGNGIQQILGVTVPPLVVLLILGSALRVGIYNTFFAVFSAVCILVVAQYRTPANRLKIYGITTLCLVAVTVWFGYAFSFAALVVYTLADGIISPVMNVSSHVIDLNSMEIGRKETDFYATMLLRDFFLWVWRLIGGGLFLCIIRLLSPEKIVLSAGLYMLAVGLVLTYAGAFVLLHIQRGTHVRS